MVALRATVRRVLARSAGDELWVRFSDLGLPGLVLPAEVGGSGASWRELGMVLEETGRVLDQSPLFSTAVLGATAIALAADPDQQARLLPELAAGKRTATLAWLEADGDWSATTVGTRAESDGDGWRLTGRKLFVADGASADVVVVVARTEAGIAAFAVDGSVDGLHREPVPTLDLTRELAHLDLVGVSAEQLGGPTDGAAVLERVLDRARIGLAAEQVGTARGALDITVEHCRSRIQFGAPIGSFQAVQHLCADVLLEVELAASAVQYALDAVARDAVDVPAAAALAQSMATDALDLAAHQCVQLHGGTGFTWEHPAHRYLKRAKASETFLGEADRHRERLAELLGL